MSQNPYEATDVAGDITGIVSGSREDLRKVASSQKALLLCLLVQIALSIGYQLAPAGLKSPIGIVLLLGGIVSAFFIFQLASRTYGIGVAIVCVLFGLVPCIGLLVLLMINQKATSVLQQNGIKVGFLGAKDPV